MHREGVQEVTQRDTGLLGREKNSRRKFSGGGMAEEERAARAICLPVYNRL